MISTILTVIAAFCFGFAAFRVTPAIVEWVPAGYCLLTVALFLV